MKASNATACISGPEIEPDKFISPMYLHIDAPSEFYYPEVRLLKLPGFLSADKICNPNNRDFKSDRVRRIIKFKRGPTTLTTVCDSSEFESHVHLFFFWCKFIVLR